MDDAQVGGGGGVEELGDLVVAVGIGVLPAVGMEVSALRGERRVGAGVLAAERVGALLSDDLPAGVGTPEGDHPVGREGFVAAVAAGEDHVDDGLEGRVEQHGEGSVDLGPVLGSDLVPRAGFGNRRHAPNLSAVPGPCLEPTEPERLSGQRDRRAAPEREILSRAVRPLLLPVRPAAPSSTRAWARSPELKEIPCARSRPDLPTSPASGT